MGIEVRSGGLIGIEGYAMRVEVDITRGLPGFHLVGLPNTAVRESRERVLAAIRNSGFPLPPGKVTVNLAPADVRKEGASHDLAIALAVIGALHRREGRAPARADCRMFIGELSLFGEVRPVRGLLAIVLDAAARGERAVTVPAAQTWEASLVPGLAVHGVRTLREAAALWLDGAVPAAAAPAVGQRAVAPSVEVGVGDGAPADQILPSSPLAARAALLAAAGGHHLFLIGPPGVGKTRLARLVAALRPPLSSAQGLEVTRIHSAAGLLARPGLIRRPPLRAPHHSTTVAGLVGGGPRLLPGEATLAHRGVLFLDEAAEFAPAVLDALREPLEDGIVRVSRGPGRCQFPARFQLVAAMNPCRCGFLGSSRRACTCPPGLVARYRSRVSGPLLDRFDLFVELADVTPADSGLAARAGLTGAEVAAMLARARRVLDARADPPECWPLERRLRAFGLEPGALAALQAAREPLGLSPRGLLRACRVARTAAALDGAFTVASRHVREALQYRREALPSLGR